MDSYLVAQQSFRDAMERRGHVVRHVGVWPSPASYTLTFHVGDWGGQTSFLTVTMDGWAEYAASCVERMIERGKKEQRTMSAGAWRRRVENIRRLVLRSMG